MFPVTVNFMRRSVLGPLRFLIYINNIVNAAPTNISVLLATPYCTCVKKSTISIISLWTRSWVSCGVVKSTACEYLFLLEQKNTHNYPSPSPAVRNITTGKTTKHTILVSSFPIIFPGLTILAILLGKPLYLYKYRLAWEAQHLIHHLPNILC